MQDSKIGKIQKKKYELPEKLTLPFYHLFTCLICGRSFSGNSYFFFESCKNVISPQYVIYRLNIFKAGLNLFPLISGPKYFFRASVPIGDNAEAPKNHQNYKLDISRKWRFWWNFKITILTSDLKANFSDIYVCYLFNIAYTQVIGINFFESKIFWKKWFLKKLKLINIFSIIFMHVIACGYIGINLWRLFFQYILNKLFFLNFKESDRYFSF